MQEEEAPIDDTTVLEIVSTDASIVFGSLSTSTIVDQRVLKLLSDDIVANERQIKDLKTRKSMLLAMKLIFWSGSFNGPFVIIKQKGEVMVV